MTHELALERAFRRSTRALDARAAELTLPGAAALAQVPPPDVPGGPGAITFEGSLSLLSLDGADERRTLGGIGLRAMLLPFAGRPDDGPWWTRAAYGAFVAFTPERDGIETLHYGAEVDVHVVPAHRVVRFDPFVALGIGGFGVRPAESIGGESATDVALSPGVGTHVVLTPRFVLRGDVRDVVVFGDETTHNPQAEIGIVLVFALPDWSRD